MQPTVPPAVPGIKPSTVPGIKPGTRSRTGLVFALASAVGLFSLAISPGCLHAGSGSQRAAPGPARDRATAAASAARSADLAFSAACVARDFVSFYGFVEEDAVFVNRDGAVAGRAAVGNDWTPFFTEGGPHLQWAPTEAEAAASGDVVFTRGDWVMTPAASGTPVTGRYLTVWRKGSDGHWRVALDGSDTPLGEEAHAATRVVLKRVFSEDDALAATAGLLMDGTREAGAFMVLQRREGPEWRVLATVGVYKPPS
jgi:ketosteroid isomerase-like protein